jgi:putative ABC transport system permease protein
MYASGLKLFANGRQIEPDGICYQKRKGSLFGTIFALGKVWKNVCIKDLLSKEKAMFKNYIKTAVRAILRHKGISLINILGLALGLACFLLIVFFIQYENSYDSFHADADRIYQMVRVNYTGDDVERRVNTGAPLAPLMLDNFPAVEEAVRLTRFDGMLVSHGQNKFIENRFFFADPSFFDVFSFALAAGDPATALNEPFTVILSRAAAKKYFGEQNPIGEVITYQFSRESYPFRVTGVLEELPGNSHMDFDFVASYAGMRTMVGDWFLTNHWDSPTWTYVKLKKGSDSAALEDLMPDFIAQHVDKKGFSSIGYEFLGLKDVYMRSPGPAIGERGNPQFVFILTLIAVLILFIAVINFMNLSTARSGIRAKEIGVRKVVGASRLHIIRQFLSEALLSSFFALILALILVDIFLPAFSSLAGKKFGFSDLINGPFLAAMGLTMILVGLFAGSYPAFYLSGFRPAFVVKGRIQKGGASAWIRKFLVVVQFAMSIILIIGSIAVTRQLHYLENREMGFNKEHLVVLPLQDQAARDNYLQLKQRMLQESHIQGMTAASMLPGVTSQNGIFLPNKDGNETVMGIIYIDPDFIKTLDIRMAAGRNFSKDKPSDESGAVLINETGTGYLGWKINEILEQPIRLYFKEGGKDIPVYQSKVTGVVKDFHFRDLSVPIQPLLFKIDAKRYRYALVRVRGDAAQEALGAMERIWDDFNFNYPFQFSFLEDEMNRVYRTTRQFSSAARYGTGWAILIACMGLFGLAAFNMERRTKEIAVRKVLGASIPGLLRLVNMEFIRLLVLGNLIAWPAAYFLSRKFLQNFAYRTDLALSIFILAAGISLGLTLLTVNFQIVRAVLADPVRSLRYE